MAHYVELFKDERAGINSNQIIGAIMSESAMRFDHNFVDEVCTACNLSDFCSETECPARLREELERVASFSQNGLVCGKHWRHPSECCNGSYTAYFINYKDVSNKKDMEFLKHCYDKMEKKIEAIISILGEE